jgi:hypothetical protein
MLQLPVDILDMIVMIHHTEHMLPGVRMEYKPIVFPQSSKERTDWMVFQLIDLDREQQKLLLIQQKIEMTWIRLLMIVML